MTRAVIITSYLENPVDIPALLTTDDYIVCLDGEYYNIDVLWDGSASESCGEDVYPFFNLTDSAFLYHDRDELAKALPKCTGTKYKYSNYFGKTVEIEDLDFEDAA